MKTNESDFPRVDETCSDVNQTFGEIHSTPEVMRKKMLEIAQYQVRREVARDWLDHLRFIVMEPSLALPEIKVFENTTDYVAVSYCWTRTVWDLSMDVTEKVIDIQEIRPWRAPQDVIYRASKYAIHHKLRLIWVDQECINQDDPIEKEKAIQSMDLVYENASHSVAILDIYLNTQSQVDALTTIVLGEPCRPELIEDLKDVLELLVEDPWFKRAWTLQESTAADARLVLLIAHDHNLKRPASFDKTPGEVEIALDEFQEAMVWVRIMVNELQADDTIQSGLSADEADEWLSDTTYCSNMADILFNCAPHILKDTASGVTRLRRGCSAALALSFLSSRRNSWYPDRLAILANLCNYEVRIATNVLTLPGFGFSLCALTLATLNGDMSLWTGYPDKSLHSKQYGNLDLEVLDRRRYDWLAGGAAAVLPHGFSWGPPATASLSNITYFEEWDEWFRLRPATLLESGLKVSGILWELNHRIPVPCTRNRYMSRWLSSAPQPSSRRLRKYDAARNMIKVEVLKGLNFEIIWHLLQELVQTGYSPLAETLWNYYRPVGRPADFYESRDSPPPEPFHEVCDRMRRDTRSSIGRPCEHNLEPVDLLRVPHDDQTNFKVSKVGALTATLLDQVFNSGTILCGRPVNLDKSLNNNVFFEDCAEGALVFTPSTELGDRTCDSIWADEAMSWLVTSTGVAADHCVVLRCIDRKCGIWRLGQLEPKDYILS